MMKLPLKGMYMRKEMRRKKRRRKKMSK